MRFVSTLTLTALLVAVATSANASGVDYPFLKEAFRIGTKPKIHELAGQVYSCREFTLGQPYATDHYDLSFQYDSSSTLRVNGRRIYRAPSLEISAPAYNETYRYTDHKNYLTVKVVSAGKVKAYASCRYNPPVTYSSSSSASSGYDYGSSDNSYSSSSSSSDSTSSSSSDTSSTSSSTVTSQPAQSSTTFGSNGVIYNRSGNTIFGSNGVTYQDNGGFIVGSDGSNCYHGYPNCP